MKNATTLNKITCGVKILDVDFNKARTDYSAREDFEIHGEIKCTNFKTVKVTCELSIPAGNTIETRVDVDYLELQDNNLFADLKDVRFPSELESSFATFGNVLAIDQDAFYLAFESDHAKALKAVHDRNIAARTELYNASPLHKLIPALEAEFESVEISSESDFVNAKNFTSKSHIRLYIKDSGEEVNVRYENQARPYEVYLNYDYCTSLKSVKRIPNSIRKLINKKVSAKNIELAREVKSQEKSNADIAKLESHKIDFESIKIQRRFSNHYENAFKISSNNNSSLSFTIHDEFVYLKAIAGKITLDQLKAIDNVLNNRIDSEL